MKKILVVLLILAVASGAFAQINFTGGFRSGLGVSIVDGRTDHAIGVTGNVGDFTARFDLNGAFTSDEGNVGVNFRLRSTGFGTNLIDVMAWGWVDVIPMIRLYVGNDGPGGMGTMGGVDTDNGVLKGMFGLRVTPIDGLTIGFTISGIGTNVGGNGFGGAKFDNANYHFGAKYIASGLFTAVANAQYKWVGGQVAKNFFDFAFGVDVAPIVGNGISKLAIDAAIANTVTNVPGSSPAVPQRTDFDITIGQAFAMSLGDLGFGLRFSQSFRENNETPVLAFTGNVTYKISTLTPRLDFGLVMGGNFASLRKGAWDALGRGAYAKEAMGFAVTPSVSVPMGKATLDFGCVIGMNITDQAKALSSNRASAIMPYIDINISF